MGGAQQRGRAETTTAAIVESAIFDPVSIRRTAFRYALRSEASLRFEKGQESRLARLGADRTAQLLAEWAGGRPAVGVVDTNPGDEEPRRVSFRPARVSRLLGQEIDAARCDRGARARRDHDRPRRRGTRWSRSCPRTAATSQIEEDVIEEIVRVRGYETLPPRLPETRPAPLPRRSAPLQGHRPRAFRRTWPDPRS